jgi:hypothetical protein
MGIINYWNEQDSHFRSAFRPGFKKEFHWMRLASNFVTVHW